MRWKRTHQLDRKLVKVGKEIDALDKEGVWCAAQIETIVYSQERPPLLKVHYKVRLNL